MIRLFTGYDAREAVGWGTFASSVLARCSQPVAITPLFSQQLDGSNAFTYARYTVPMLCNYEGFAIFADGCDMVCLGDLGELWAMRDEQVAVQVVQHLYTPKHGKKYLGTEMESRNVPYRCKNWSSLMLINCGHPKHRAIEAVTPSLGLHQFNWLSPGEVGSLPMEWNWLVDEYGENDTAKLVHWTTGIPAFAAYRDAPMSQVWFGEYFRSQRGIQSPAKEGACP